MLDLLDSINIDPTSLVIHFLNLRSVPLTTLGQDMTQFAYKFIDEYTSPLVA